MTRSQQAGVWPTKVKVQCRAEPVFEATIRFRYIPSLKVMVPQIDCPNCARGYILQPDGVWMSDRPLKFIEYV